MRKRKKRALEILENPMSKRRQESWGRVAEVYDASFVHAPDSYHVKVLLPNVLRVLAPTSDMRVLEVGCGNGFFAQAIAESGAQVCGVDIAPEMIEQANTQDGNEVEFQVASADALPYEEKSFDAVVCVLALQNIARVAEAIGEAARVLVPGGRFLIVLNHPVLRIPKRSSWGWDDEGKVQYRRLDGYMSESSADIEMNPGARAGAHTTTSFHRPLQVYCKALAKAGFAVTALEEWISHKKSEKGPRAHAEDEARKEFPLFLMLMARKMV